MENGLSRWRRNRSWSDHFRLRNCPQIKQARNRLTKDGGDNYEETCVTFGSTVLPERFWNNRECDWDQYRRWGSTLLRAWTGLLVWQELLRLGPGTLGRMALRPPRLDPRPLSGALII